jgi:hypothetical protein
MAKIEADIGGMTLESGTLVLATGATVGSGAITFAPGAGATLVLAAGVVLGVTGVRNAAIPA